MSACRRHYPGRIDGTDSLMTAPSTSAFPSYQLGRLLHYQFRGPAQRSLVLQPADSPSRLMRPFPPEAPAALLPPPPLRLLPGGAIQFPGGSFIPLWTSAFSRRTVIGIYRQPSI